MRHSVKLINKKTWNMSSALKIATAKCAHWSYCLSNGRYKLPQCSRWIPNISLSFSLYLSLYLSRYLPPSFSLSKTCLVYDIICLLIPPLSCCLNYYHYRAAASKPCCRQDRVRARIACRAAPVNSISTEVGINIFRPIQMIQGWCRLLLQITLCTINTYKDGDNIKYTQRI